MPPHCDALDGPVVRAARRALDEGNVDLVLPFVHEEGDEEVRLAFERTTRARAVGGEAAEVADLWFFETAVRVHRAGEGAPYTGLKPAGLDVGPVIPVAERAIESGSADELARVLTDLVRHQVAHRFKRVMDLKVDRGGGLKQAREYTEAMLGLQVWSHKLAKCATADAHERHREEGA